MSTNRTNVKFKGIMPALVTPFEADNRSIDVKAAQKIIEYQLGQGADGFYILGGTGEGLVMQRPERELMCEVAVKQVAGRKPVINHIAAMNLQEACELAKHAERVGADAIASVPPFFYFYDEDDIYNYYKKLAESVHIPLIIYYHPSAQRNMSVELISRIFEIDNVTGVKWSCDDYYNMMRLKDVTQGEMNIINGPDECLLCGLTSGADAGIGSTYNVMVPQFLEIYRLFREGRMEEARAAQLRVNRVIHAMLKHEVIPSVKHACKMIGIDVGTATYPMRQMTGEKAAALESDLRAAGFPFAK